MKYEKLISICMIIKNEEKNLPRCLESIKSVINSGLAELIVVDTGSNDLSIEISKKYTDQVYQHEWTNNFSEMRNISISYAKGEWIWIIDADEEIQDIDELIKLYDVNLKKYNTIMVKTKNYMETPTEDKEPLYTVFSQPRGFRNTKDFCFKGAVHNQPIFKEPIYASNIVFEHYGYIWEDKEFTKAKFERTSSILKKELQKDPDNVYYQFQLATSWANVDKSIALKEVRKAHKLLQRLPKDERALCLYVFMLYARIANNNQRYLESIEICKEGLSYSKDLIDLWYLAGISYMGLNDYKNAEEYLLEYMDLRKRFWEKEISNDSSLAFYHLDSNSENVALYDLSLIELENSNYSEAIKYISRMSAGDFKTDIVVKYSMEKEDYSDLIEYLKEVFEDSNKKASLVLNIESNILNKTGKEELYKQILNLYEYEGFEKNSYYILNKVRTMINTDKNITLDMLGEIKELPLDELPNYYGDIIYYSIQNDVDLVQLGDLGSIEMFQNKLKYVDGKYEEFNQELLRYLKGLEVRENDNSLSYWIVLARYILVEDVSELLDDEKYMLLFEKYIELGGAYIQYVYNPQIIEEEMTYHMKNDEHRFFLYLKKANQLKNKDTKTYLRYLNKALKVYPVKRGLESLLNEVKEKEQRNKNEMDLLKEQFKNNIKMLIESNMLVQAEELIKQYEGIAVDDIDILLFKSQISVLKLEGKDNDNIIN